MDLPATRKLWLVDTTFKVLQIEDIYEHIYLFIVFILDKFRIIQLDSTTKQSTSVRHNISLFFIETLQNKFPSWINSVVFRDDCSKHTYECSRS